MSTLAEILLNPGTRSKVIDDTCQLIDEEVAGKGGLTGIAIKGAYSVVKAIRPGFIRETVDALLDDFIGRLEPFHTQAQEKGTPTDQYMASRPSEVANALLAITDERATRAKNKTVKSAYDRLRPTAEKHVEAAMPRVTRMVGKYTNAA